MRLKLAPFLQLLGEPFILGRGFVQQQCGVALVGHTRGVAIVGRTRGVALVGRARGVAVGQARCCFFIPLMSGRRVASAAGGSATTTKPLPSKHRLSTSVAQTTFRSCHVAMMNPSGPCA